MPGEESGETQPNRYAPPEAAVADVAVHDAPPARCPHVELAIRLMWVSFGFSIANNILKIVLVPTLVAKVFMIIGGLLGAGIGYAILSWVTRKLRDARNWMRWLITALNVLSWLSVGVFWDFYRDYIFRALSLNVPVVVGLVVSTTINVVVLVLLHTPATRAWFAAHSAAR